eukprot:762672-Hanusia_phi.AAC.3
MTRKSDPAARTDFKLRTLNSVRSDHAVARVATCPGHWPRLRRYPARGLTAPGHSRGRAGRRPRGGDSVIIAGMTCQPGVTRPAGRRGFPPGPTRDRGTVECGPARRPGRGRQAVTVSKPSDADCPCHYRTTGYCGRLSHGPGCPGPRRRGGRVTVGRAAAAGLPR